MHLVIEILKVGRVDEVIASGVGLASFVAHSSRVACCATFPVTGCAIFRHRAPDEDLDDGKPFFLAVTQVEWKVGISCTVAVKATPERVSQPVEWRAVGEDEVASGFVDTHKAASVA